MKRIDEVPGASCGGGTDPQDIAATKSACAVAGTPGGAPARIPSCASAVELAGVLLAHTMQESEAPISQLSEALARVANSLNGDRPGSGRGGAAASGGQAARETITRDLAVCIEQLQFHDRLMQQLTRVHAILAALATNRQLAEIPAQPSGAGGNASQGSIELF